MKILSLASVLLASFTLAAVAAEPHTITVRGEGELKVAPDVAIVSISVQSKAKDAKAAQAKNAEAVNRAMKILKKDFGISDRDIQSTGISVNPEYRYENNGKQTFIGFAASSSFTVRTKKIDTAGTMLDALISGDANSNTTSQGISFDSDRRRDLETEALGLAMKNAGARADALAGFAKKSLKGVLRISESNVQFEPFRVNQAARPMMAAFAAGGAAKDAPTPVAAGEISITASVAVDYEMN